MDLNIHAELVRLYSVFLPIPAKALFYLIYLTNRPLDLFNHFYVDGNIYVK